MYIICQALFICHWSVVNDNLLHPREAERLEALRELDILDTPPEESYDRIVELAAEICKTPISTITLIDEDRQWFKAKFGVERSEDPREIAFCAHCILNDTILEVKDASIDPRFKNNPLVTSGPKIRFYAGAPLYSVTGLPIGSLCVIDQNPRELTPTQRKTLIILAKQISSELELRLVNKHLAIQSRKSTLAHDNLQQLFSIISHDLRAPFQGFLGLTKLMEDSYEEFSRDDILETIGLLSESAHETYTLLENLLEWSTHEVGSIRYHPKNTNLSSIAEAAAEALSSTADKKKISVDIDISEDLFVYADPKMIGSILRNLINNSIKFTPDNGQIDLSAQIDGDSVDVSVSDTGIGLSPEQIKMLTDDGSLETSLGTHGERGTGLGLHLVHLFLREHQSSLQVQSTQGEGSTIHFRLPVKADSPLSDQPSYII